MSNYVKTYNFAAKDSLQAGDPSKTIKGTEFEVEFDAIAAAVNSKQDSDAELIAIAGLTSAADVVPRFTGSGTAETFPLTSGTYTPTATSLSNVTSVTPAEANYVRIGSIVHIAGAFSAVIGTGSASFELSLPIASDFTATSDLAGAGVLGQTTTIALGADIANNTLQTSFVSSSSTTWSGSFIAQYQIK